MSEPLLRVENLSVAFVQGDRRVQAVDDVSFDMPPSSRVGVIGESGSGKTVSALSVLRLHNERNVVYGADSRIVYRGTDVLRMSDRELRAFRGGQIGMIFQNPMTSLNPTFTIGSQIMSVIRLHHGVSKAEARKRAIAAYAEVELPNPGQQLGRYPNELSGGQRQRALIAQVLACDPTIIIADEPTSALDVTVQAGILEMLLERTTQREISVLMITHDMGVVSRFCDEVNVMYAGMIVESGPIAELFSHPRHPYTSGLLQSIPSLTSERIDRLYSIPGRQAQRTSTLDRCPFIERCDHAKDVCSSSRPALEPVSDGHLTACVRHTELELRGVGRDGPTVSKKGPEG